MPTPASYRPAETSAVVAQDVSSFTLTFHDKNGGIVAPSVLAASVDVSAQVRQVDAGTQQSDVSLTGIRLSRRFMGDPSRVAKVIASAMTPAIRSMN